MSKAILDGVDCFFFLLIKPSFLPYQFLTLFNRDLHHHKAKTGCSFPRYNNT